MKNKKLVELWAKENSVNLETVNFYENLEGSQPDSEYGCCDISGVSCNVSWCTAGLTDSDETFEFQACENLIGGALGKLAGAF